MITLETVLSFALQDPVVLDQLGPALRDDLVTANPFYRQIITFADDFLLAHRKLPGTGDWSVWLETLPAGMQRDSCREALGRLLATPVQGYDPAYFADQVVPMLQQGAAQVARDRLNALPVVEPGALQTIAAKVDAIRGGGLQGLAHLSDIDVWAHPVREDDVIGTGFPRLDRIIGGWGKELWMAFADSGVGKSMLLQNWATNVALRGKRVLHVSLELGLGPQIRRYYRQIATMPPGDFGAKNDEVKRRLRQWFRLAQGEVLLLEYGAYGMTVDDLKRVLERVNRTQGKVDVLVLDYLDLLEVKHKAKSGYEDLGRLTHETRALCGAFDLTVLTVSQSVRRPAHKNRLTVRDMGDSYNKVRAADGLLSLVQTEEEEESHQGRLGLLKVRDHGGRNVEIPLYVNRELAVIQELDHPNTRKLMERLGHLAQPAPATPPPPPTTPPPPPVRKKP